MTGGGVLYAAFCPQDEAADAVPVGSLKIRLRCVC